MDADVSISAQGSATIVFSKDLESTKEFSTNTLCRAIMFMTVLDDMEYVQRHVRYKHNPWTELYLLTMWPSLLTSDVTWTVLIQNKVTHVNFKFTNRSTCTCFKFQPCKFLWIGGDVFGNVCDKLSDEEWGKMYSYFSSLVCLVHFCHWLLDRFSL